MSFAFALLLLSGADFGLDPAWKLSADPMAPARAGRIQCHYPDPAARSCAVMTWYDVRPDGSARTRSITALSDELRLAAEARMEIRPGGSGGMCGVIDDDHLATYRIVQNRAPFAPVDNKQLYLLYREALIEALWNRTHCALNYSRADSAMQLDVSTVDGQFAGEMMAEFIWVDPKAGWRLKARPPG